MAKYKKIQGTDNKFLISDDTTNEPLAISTKSGSGKYATYDTKWHPHVLQTHPEANNILSRPNESKTIENAVYTVNSEKNRLETGKEHEFDVQKDLETVKKIPQYHSEESSHDVYHIVDKETGNKVLSLTIPSKISESNIGTNSTTDSFLFHKQHLGNMDNLNTAVKQAKNKGNGATLKQWVDTATALKKTVSSGGPRFVGQSTSSGEKSTKKVYKTSIQDPKSAIDAYITSGAIPNHEKLEKTVITPSMQLVHSDDENHVVKFKDGEIHHSSTRSGSYKTELNHVIEQVE